MSDTLHTPLIRVTSNEPAGEKHLVLPYGEHPVVQRAGQRTCVVCGNPDFRRSRLRLDDLPWMCMLHWPIRCTRCAQRQHASMFTAGAARRPRPRSGEAIIGPQHWGAWTGQPATTVPPTRQGGPAKP